MQADPASGLKVDRLTELTADQLAQLVDHGRESLGEAALDQWMIPVVARWGYLFVADAGGEIVGSAQCLRVREEGEIYLDILYIRPEFRMRGHGTALLAEVCRQMRGQGYRRMLATADPRNEAAISIYESAGFRQADMLQDFYGPGHDRLLLETDLGEGNE